jgi:peroxiredoxin
MKITLMRTHWVCISALLFAFAGTAIAADQSTVRAVLQPPNERKPAAELALQDASGRTASLKDYRGQVLLLDFWATWCHGCKEEIPWFVDLQKTYGAKGLAVVGVSMDEDGWKVVKPFIADTHLPYRILLGDAGTRQRYEITGLPDTFLLDRQGRVAAVYRAGLVNKDDVEANIKALLANK